MDSRQTRLAVRIMEERLKDGRTLTPETILKLVMFVKKYSEYFRKQEFEQFKALEVNDGEQVYRYSNLLAHLKEAVDGVNFYEFGILFEHPEEHKDASTQEAL
jgi:hypothetical protein